MRLFKKLEVNGQKYQVEKDTIRLDIDRPGVAIFQVLSEAPLEGQVSFAMNWNFSEDLILYFTGEVEKSTTVDNKRQRLLCRELSARIDDVKPIALRHPTLREVLEKYGQLAELEFIIPAKDYADIKVPAFYGFGSAYHAMQNIGKIFKVHNYVWLTQGDGKIFVGSWDDSFWKGKVLNIPENVFTIIDEESKKMPVAPSIRPGCKINGQLLKSIAFSGHEATLSF